MDACLAQPTRAHEGKLRCRIDKEPIVEAWVGDVVADCREEKGEGVERAEHVAVCAAVLEEVEADEGHSECVLVIVVCSR